MSRQSVEVIGFLADRLKVQLREQGARHDLVDAVFALGESKPAIGAVKPSPLAGEGREGGPRGTTPAGALSSTTDDGIRGGPPSLTLPREGGGDGHTPVVDGAMPAGPSGVGQASAAPRPQDDLVLVVKRVEALGKFLETEDGKNLLAGTRRAANILRIEEKKDGRAFDGPVDPARLVEPAEKALFEAIVAAKATAADAVAREDFAAAMAALASLRAPVDTFFDAILVNADDKAVRENRLTLLNEIRAATLTVADFSKIAG